MASAEPASRGPAPSTPLNRPQPRPVPALLLDRRTRRLPWRDLSQEQARVGKAWRALEDRLGAIGPAEQYDYHARIAFAGYVVQSRTDRPDRFNALGLRRRYGLVLDGVGPDHPVLRVLGATLRRFREAGIPAVVYVNPMNVEQLGDVGIDSSHLGESVAAVAFVARENGAEFLDLHAEFGEIWFSDAPGHYRSDEERDGPREIAARLAPYVARAARSAR